MHASSSDISICVKNIQQFYICMTRGMDSRSLVPPDYPSCSTFVDLKVRACPNLSPCLLSSLDSTHHRDSHLSLTQLSLLTELVGHPHTVLNISPCFSKFQAVRMSKFSITNVRIFDGEKVVQEQGTVTIDQNGLITDDHSCAASFDATGMTILPSLWDTHVHVFGPGVPTSTSIASLSDMLKCGITTAIDTGKMSKEQHDLIQNRPELPDIRFTGNFATSTGSTHSKFQMADSNSIVDDVEAATTFVSKRVNEGADYIKIVADVPGPSQAIIDQLSSKAKEHGMMTIVHASINEAFRMALKAQPDVNIITHVPMDKDLAGGDASRMATKNTVAVPTLAMSEVFCKAGFKPHYKFPNAMESAKQLHRAGVTILVGTDSNHSPVGPKHGESLFREVELLAEAGMEPIEILTAATKLSAKCFDMLDRGVIAPGKRADLLLVDGNPTEDLQALRKVVKVWKAGKEVYSVSSSATSHD
ncbi:hypothetical protein BCR34DRAFT_574295 [Clohesyomyces aquaticus]|uniref:Amidohydrolase-related domain-containing protein n=1 Tax=Clohesyomyces aquaticus TaxID=1231657 RepID=A0A1Y1YWN3_9PLEO|nr:hypothetical protein BCR34DRAFT_574295 [Clohesyomyces aquaticus]